MQKLYATAVTLNELVNLFLISHLKSYMNVHFAF